MTEVRAAVAADALQVAGVHVRSWQSAYRGLLAQEYLDSLQPEVLARRYTFGRAGLRMPSTVVAVDGSVVCGFATTGLCSDNDLSNVGELMALYVDPASLRTGVGRLLMAAGWERLRRVGVTEAVLWVLNENVRARQFYERDGWWLDGTCRTETFGDSRVQQVRYRCTPL
ncbi:MAG TPA: GNAT family N-acetyltransferase [Mycobacterium sp.]|nr:GNAT family N-acetyltransferase [Mycobacterium sp.]HTX96436.1 GNAT family N-acetyltransferase [Mycobacterium sp.]